MTIILPKRCGAWLATTGLCALLAWLPAPATAQETLLPGFDPAQEEQALFVLGNTLFAFYHGLGKALIESRNLPLEGTADATAGKIASLLLIPQTPDPLRDELAIAAGDGLATAAGGVADDHPLPVFWGEQGFDEALHTSFVCLLVGSDPDGFYDYAIDSGLTEPDIAACKTSYPAARERWTKLLEPAAGAPEGSLRIVYEEAGAEFARERDVLSRSGVFEATAKSLPATVALPPGLSLNFRRCGDANARWDAPAGQVVICYEFVKFLNDLATANGEAD